MKKVILFSLALSLLALPLNAKKPQLAQLVWFLMERQSNLEKQPNDSITISYKITHGHRMPNRTEKSMEMWYPQPHLVITVLNNSERDIFIDLQKSFLVVNKELYPLFTNTTDVYTQGGTSITGVNLGLVGVGAASSDFNTKVTHEQRFLNVPAETKKSLDVPLLTKWNASWQLNEANGTIYIHQGYDSRQSSWNYDPDFVVINNGFSPIKEVLNYEDPDNPLTLDIRICYSYNEDMNPAYTAKSVYWTTHIIGTGNGNGYADKQLDLARKLFPNLDSYSSNKNKLLMIVQSF